MNFNLRSLTWAIVKVGVVFGVVAGGIWTVTHRQDIVDWWELRSYQPSQQVAALADATTMIGRGRDLFYVSDPKIQDGEAFNQSCSGVGEEGAVLGCYTMQKIYLFNVTDKRLPKVKEVTAAHEMLHAAYERLDSVTKENVDRWVQAEADKHKNNKDLQEVMKIYIKTEPTELLNELHSIIGTEFNNLAPELEEYYKRYFSDRSKVVGYAQAYKAVFEASKQRITNYDKQLENLKKQVLALEAELKQRKTTLANDGARLRALRETDPVSYNQQVPGYNNNVRNFNARVAEYNSLVAQFNATVVERNKEAAAQNDLYHSLDSQYQPL